MARKKPRRAKAFTDPMKASGEMVLTELPGASRWGRFVTRVAGGYWLSPAVAALVSFFVHLTVPNLVHLLGGSSGLVNASWSVGLFVFAYLVWFDGWKTLSVRSGGSAYVTVVGAFALDASRASAERIGGEDPSLAADADSALSEVSDLARDEGLIVRQQLALLGVGWRDSRSAAKRVAKARRVLRGDQAQEFFELEEERVALVAQMSEVVDALKELAVSVASTRSVSPEPSSLRTLREHVDRQEAVRSAVREVRES